MSNKMIRWNIAHIAALIVLIYLVAVLFLPYVLNGTLYHVHSPVPVEVNGGVITLRANRTSKIAMSADNYTRIICNDVVHVFDDVEGFVGKTDGVIAFTRVAPDYIYGDCIIEGRIEYTPLPLLGLETRYYSEKFTIEKIDN